jgi:hypothetical protein
LIGAIADNSTAFFPFGAGSNNIQVFYSERLGDPNGVARSTNNYVLTVLGTTNRVAIRAVAYNSTLQGFISVEPQDPNWIYGGQYLLTVNNVFDSHTNRIAPDSHVIVQWPHRTNLISTTDLWSFHAAAWIDAGVYDENWMGSDFQESSWWASGYGPFSGGTSPDASCMGIFNTETGFQPEPMLFRTSFFWPTNWPSTGLFSFNVTFDDGVILFLNGREFWRTNVVGSVTSPFIRASGSASACFTNLTLSVTNLLPGTNWLAAAVVQADGPDGDSAFGFQLRGTVVLGSELGDESRSELSFLPTGFNSLRLSWTGGGYRLESSTNLSGETESYPFGPWQEVPKVSNPYTNSLEGPARFFRLKQ